ncbi:MAG: type II toxin-antitoxin system ParD family antitoxin [Pseudomonadota bacterium]|nr:type II toxin-antitoxin system ParD family antitoxin [Pseudomonadota bacterium]MDP1905894.1 type II toxin-antitoxin system ParD family antitoxin [Pseudomonadota bacterium]MDP2351766.1 type II toxin-antitoxin system ParD family antitoxin [Pseudomonadota bacterium]
MHLNLSAEMEQYLQAKVGSGFYGNVSEVVRDAIRRMRDEDEKLTALRAAVRAGDDQLALGQGRDYSQERLEQITEQARANSRNGKKVGGDVTP